MHHIIISRYSEHIDPLVHAWIRDPKYTVHIYNKGPDDIQGSKSLPNVGREAHTFSRACMDLYDSLEKDDRITFLQAGFRDHVHLDVPDSNPSQPIIPLAHVTTTCDINGRPHHDGLRLDLAKPRLEAILGISLPNVFRFAPGAQYTVRASCILRHSKEAWEDLTRVLGREYTIETHNHDGIDPWQMERFWWYVFTSSI